MKKSAGSNLSLAFCASYHPTATQRRAHSIHPALSPTCTRGQFAKRLRPSTVLDGDVHHRSQPSSTPAQPPNPTFITPTASLVSSLSSLASTGAGVFILGFIVFVHESGHFLAARLQGIRVKNFSIGFGPTLFSFVPSNSETEFTIRLLPLGGYVAFPEHMKLKPDAQREKDDNSDNSTSNNNPSNETSSSSGTESNEKEAMKRDMRQFKEEDYEIDQDPNLLQNRPVLDRAIVVSAGVVANIILAWFAIFTSVSTVGLPTYDVQPGTVIASIVDPSGPAARDGLMASDIILSVNGENVVVSLDSASSVAEKIRVSKGQQLNFEVLRGDSERLNIQVKPKCCLPDGSSSVGIQLVPNAKVTRVRPGDPVKVVRMTNAEFARLSKQTWRGLSSLIVNFKTSSQNLSGPIGVVSMGADLARNDTAALFTFCAVISINLALINSLPLPALDGGQMTFLIIEALRGSPVSLKVQDAVNRTALVILLAFSGVLFFGDIERLNLFGAIQKLFG